MGSTPCVHSRDCVQAGHAVVQGVLAVAGDAARILQWGHDAPAAVATFSLVASLLLWTKQLCELTSGLLLL